jgi:hypothetical protein
MMDQFTRGALVALSLLLWGRWLCTAEAHAGAAKQDLPEFQAVSCHRNIVSSANRSPDSLAAADSLLADVMMRLVGMSRAVGAPFGRQDLVLALDFTFSFFCFPLGIFFALF